VGRWLLRGLLWLLGIRLPVLRVLRLQRDSLFSVLLWLLLLLLPWLLLWLLLLWLLWLLLLWLLLVRLLLVRWLWWFGLRYLGRHGGCCERE
jgi:hypothetical protein